MMQVRLLSILGLVLIQFWSFGQETKEMSYDEFIGIVKDHHPVMVQADQRVKVAEGQLLESKGAFDPTITGSVEQKEFENQKYFQLAEAGLVVPTWIGANVKAGYTQSIGDYVNAMDQLPAKGLVYAGVEIPIGQGLFYDKRRESLDKAKVYLNISELDRQLLVNDLIYKASKDYWRWYEKYHQKIAVANLVAKSKLRLENIVRSAELGDKPYIDTLEASIQYQNFRSMLIDYETAEQNARAFVNVHMWADGYLPLELDTTAVPQQMEETLFDIKVWLISNDSLITSHPKLGIASSKISLNEIELKLAKEYLKPKLSITYNFLNEPVEGDVIGFNPNDYKFGLDLEIPIFLRNARGQVQKEKAELLIAESEMQWTKEQLRAGFITTVNNSKNALEQSQLLSEIVTNYRNLVSAERKLYQVGESSLMMLNYREIALLEAEVKWIEKVSKAKVAEIDIMYALGQLN